MICIYSRPRKDMCVEAHVRVGLYLLYKVKNVNYFTQGKFANALLAYIYTQNFPPGLFYKGSRENADKQTKLSHALTTAVLMNYTQWKSCFTSRALGFKCVKYFICSTQYKRFTTLSIKEDEECLTKPVSWPSSNGKRGGIHVT